MKQFSFLFKLFIALIGISSPAFGQGSLMLAGGGAESAGGWSDIPYRWVVEHALNKRIAVITYDTGATEWIPNYFKGFGAKSAKNFIINSRILADQQAIYDSLVTYNGVFIKGGDQAKYYEYYKGTKTQKALQYIYDKGGVLSGTSAGTAILSPIVYTAQVASVEPSAALLDTYSPQITLADDFLKTISGKYIFDTHFIERGRLGRLPAFMASWYKKTGVLATGFGIDDHTALCIEKDGKATVYGTGTVSMIKNLNASKPFNTNLQILSSTDLTLAQTPHGCTIDMNTTIVSGLKNLVKPKKSGEMSLLRIICTGTEYPSDEAFDYFVNQIGAISDPIVIVTGNTLTRANDIKSKLLDKGALAVSVLQAISGNENDLAIKDKLNQARKIFIIANEYADFMKFIKSGDNGTLLQNKLQSKNTVSFFAGDNARFAGKTVINKYTGFGYVSYNGSLEFLPGLGLLRTTALMPNSFFSAETVENTVSGLPYAMIKDTLQFGCYLSGSACAEVNYSGDGKLYLKNLSGYFPVIVLENKGTMTGFVNQGPNALSRNIAGFENMNLNYLGIGDRISIGDLSLGTALPYKMPKVRLFPNPATKDLQIEADQGSYEAGIYNQSGILLRKLQFSNKTRIGLEGFSAGMYLVRLTEKQSYRETTFKLIIN